MPHNEREPGDIEKVAECIHMFYGLEENPIAVARRINGPDGAGWTYERRAPLGNVIRTDGQKLSASDLEKAIRIAERWVDERR